MTSQEIVFEEARAQEAVYVSQFLNELTAETDLIIKDRPSLAPEQMAEFLLKQSKSARDICLLAKSGSQVLGLLNLVSFQMATGGWSGDLFLAVAKDYRGYGLGQTLLELVLDWAQETQLLEQLELTVQVRNKPALHLYRKFGFEIVSRQKAAVLSRDNQYLDIYSMSRAL
ncbi:N-acetyltransferase family protein [Streptococcus dentasini]